MTGMGFDLVVDVGNTRVKLALFQDGRIQRRGSPRADAPDLDGFLAGTAVGRVVLGAVGVPPEGLEDSLQRLAPLLVVSGSTPAPVRNAYGTPLSLGVDRLANAAAVVRLFPHRPVVAIDLGSCITCDLVDDTGTYLGGSISPGLRMRARAMNAYSARLPVVDPPIDPGRLGDSTLASIAAGLHFGVLDELKGAIAAFRQRWPDMAVVLTGGDAPRFMGGLESGIFAHPFLTLAGLHAILEHNAVHPVAPPGGAHRDAGAGTAG